MKMEIRGIARKTGQIPTHYLTETSFPENGCFRSISGRKVSGTIAGSLHAKPGPDLMTRAEVKTTVLLVP